MRLTIELRTLFIFIIGIALFSGTVSARPAILDFRSNDAQRKVLLEDSAHVLAELYQAQPEAKASVESAYGYATFSNFGTKILFVGSSSGRGVAVNNRTGQKTFMNMAEVQAGLGLGVKSFMLIWVFENAEAFNSFVNSGWEIGGQAAAAAKAGKTGGAFEGAVQVSSGVYVYQLTGSGLAVELTAKGTKYYKDNDLNNQ